MVGHGGRERAPPRRARSTSTITARRRGGVARLFGDAGAGRARADDDRRRPTRSSRATAPSAARSRRPRSIPTSKSRPRPTTARSRWRCRCASPRTRRAPARRCASPSAFQACTKRLCLPPQTVTLRGAGEVGDRGSGIGDRGQIGARQVGASGVVPAAGFSRAPIPQLPPPSPIPDPRSPIPDPRSPVHSAPRADSWSAFLWLAIRWGRCRC